MDREKLMKMATAVRTGGKGTVRRKKKAVHKTNHTDDKKLQTTLKRLMVNTVAGVEEVSIYKDDSVIQFFNPKVQASVQANTWVVSGTPHTKKLEDLFSELSAPNLKKIFDQLVFTGGAAAAAAAEEDEHVPDLVPGETFEAAAIDLVEM